MSVTRVPSWRRSHEPSAFAKGSVLRALFLAITVSALGAPAHAHQPRQVIGYAGVLGEWELSADVTEARSGELSGPATMTHVGLCTQDGPEKKTGDIGLQTSASRQSASALQQSAIGWATQPRPGSHASRVQALLSSQVMGVWTQPEVASQVSVVQASASLQSRVAPAWQMPVARSQVSRPSHAS